MATLAQTMPAIPQPWVWFRAFLKEELTPYPGRAATVARMVLAATLVMILCMTLHVPYAFQGAIYVLFISRESPRATLQSGGTIPLVVALGAAYVLISVSFVISLPILHFVWIPVSLFLAFFALGTMRDYVAASIFTIMIAVGVPVWDRHLPAHINVEDTLWVSLQALIAVAVTAAVELAFVRRKPGDEIVLPLADRLDAVHALLAGYLEDRVVSEAGANALARLSMLGTSRLRRLLRRSAYSPQYRLQMSGVAALVGRLVDIAAALPQLSFKPSSNDQKPLRELAAAVANVRTDLMNRQVAASLHFSWDDKPTLGVPLLLEMAKIVEFIPEAFAGNLSADEYRPAAADPPRSKVFVSDAFANPEHLKFALRGCAAASLCYIIYSAVDWPGISTAIATCLVTGLSSIGASRQKQVLRVTGAAVGGFLFGMGSQIFILPYLDSIAGFTVLFIIVTAVACWFMTSSPRLSYFGVQIALAFYLINLQEFTIQTSLPIARDRIVGILLGLSMMWLVFDQLGGAHAGTEMKRAFISVLRLLAQLEREPLSTDLRAAAERSYSLRETINGTFDNIRSLADGVLFEFGPTRQQDLAMRDRFRRWGPMLRLVFAIRIALLKYRFQLPSFELPEAVCRAQQEFENQLGETLDRMAGRIEGGEPGAREDLQQSFESLEHITLTCLSELPPGPFAEQAQTFLALSRRIKGLTSGLDSEI
ncbi:MAG TPA: FUSC family protein [Terriglobales bacterium]